MTNEQRFETRLALEAAGAACAGYDGGFQLQIKRQSFGDVCIKAAELGLRLRERSLMYFPLGSDNPPEDFRHWCPPYVPERGFDRPGFWLYATFESVNGDTL